MRTRRWLESPRILLLAVVVGALLTAPTLFTGLQTEDFIQRARVLSRDIPFPWTLNLYGHSAPLSAESIERINLDYQIRGWFPWVTHPLFDVSFWRPLSSLTHHLDYRLWPESPWIMHLQSVFWYAGLVAAAAALFRRTLNPPWVAGLSSLLYAIDDAHGHPVGWLVNRNGVMAAFFGVLSILLFDRWRRDRSRWSGVLMPIALAAGLLCAEYALCAAGYLIAYSVFIDEGPMRQRLKAALPWLSVLAAWALTYRALGHAAFGSGLYIHPLSEPVAFLFEISERVTVLFAGQFGIPPSDLWTWVDRSRQGPVVFAAAMVSWIVIKLFWPVIRDDRALRFYAGGLVLSLPPACAAFPEDRLLFFAGIGAMPLIASFIARVGDASTRTSLFEHPRLSLALAGVLVVLHAAVAPALLPYRSLHMHRYENRMDAAGQQLYRSVRNIRDTSLIIVNGQDFYFLGMIGMTRTARRLPTVGRTLALAGTLDSVELTRLGLRTIRVRPEDGFMSRVFNLIYRGRTHPMTRGMRIPLGGIDVEITDVNQWGEPTVATFEFPVPLEDPHLIWTVWQDGAYRSFSVPKVGETVIIRGES